MISQLYMAHRLRRRIRQKNTQLKKLCASTDAKPLTQNFATPFKTSDTVFILGSGSSINQITNKQWEIIANNDSIGFNNWTVHPFIPTYFFFEPTSNKNDFQKRVNRTLYSNLLNRKDDYQQTPIIFGYLEKYFYDWPIISNFPHTAFSASANLPAKNYQELQNSYTCALSLNYFNEIANSVYRRGSVARILHFCLSIGYKNIVLLGVDLNTQPYFFDETEFELAQGAEKLWYTQEIPTTKVHETVDPNVHPVTMLDVINILSQNIAPKMDSTIYNGSRLSALIDHLPFYWNKAPFHE